MQNSTIKEAVTALVQDLYRRHGEVTASHLVEACKSPKSPAHAAFEWDNGKAAAEYRLMQARHWVKLVKIRVDEDAATPVETLIHIPSSTDDEGREGVYKPLSVVVKSVDEFTLALDEAMQKLHAARRAVELLRQAAEREPRPERTAMVIQIARGLDILSEAMQFTAH